MRNPGEFHGGGHGLRESSKILRNLASGYSITKRRYLSSKMASSRDMCSIPMYTNIASGPISGTPSSFAIRKHKSHFRLKSSRGAGRNNPQFPKTNLNPLKSSNATVGKPYGETFESTHTKWGKWPLFPEYNTPIMRGSIARPLWILPSGKSPKYRGLALLTAAARCQNSFNGYRYREYQN